MFCVSKNSLLSNAKCKIFPDGSKDWVVCNKPIFVPKGWECVKDERIIKSILNRPHQYSKDNSSRSDNISRARRRIFEIARCNDFTHFVTLTISNDNLNRYDVDEVKKAIRNWLHNMTKRYNLVYLLVPELHKDGAIHFHALVKGDLKLVDSGHKDKNGHTIYNLPQWKYGFTEAIAVYGDYENVCKYICKYISKDTDKKIFGQFYLAGGKGLILNPETEVFNLDFSEFEHLKQYSPSEKPDLKFVYPFDDEVRFSLGEIIEI